MPLDDMPGIPEFDGVAEKIASKEAARMAEIEAAHKSSRLAKIIEIAQAAEKAAIKQGIPKEAVKKATAESIIKSMLEGTGKAAGMASKIAGPAWAGLELLNPTEANPAGSADRPPGPPPLPEQRVQSDPYAGVGDPVPPAMPPMPQSPTPQAGPLPPSLQKSLQGVKMQQSLEDRKQMILDTENKRQALMNQKIDARMSEPPRSPEPARSVEELRRRYRSLK